MTHDQVEAMTLGQRVAVMRDGRIQQVDAPQKLYDKPENIFVAAFIGSPAMNLVEARIDGQELVLRAVPRAAGRGAGRHAAERESSSASAPRLRRRFVRSSTDLPTIEVEVAVLEELGADAHVFFRVDAPR